MTVSKPKFAVTRALQAIGLIALMFILSAWQGGNVSSSTINVVAFNAATAAGVSATFQNIGASSHWLTYCNDVNVSTIQIELDASFDNVVWFSITPPGTTATVGCQTLEAGGYFPYLHANLVSITGAGAHVTAYYSASSFPIADGGIGQLGKSSQPVTFVAASSRSQQLVTTCTTPVAIFVGPLALYGLSITNFDAATDFVEVFDSVGSAGNKYDVQYSIPANSTQPIIIPTTGVQINGTLQAEVCTTQTGSAAPGSGVRVAAMYKLNPTVTTQAGVGGAISQSTKGAAQ